MSITRLAGHILLWCGFLVGAYLAVQHVENVADKWSTIRWPLYLAALAVGTIGVGLLRVTQKQAATHSDKLDADIKILDVSIKNLLAELATMLENQKKTDVYQVHKLIDSQLMASIDNFVMARSTLIHTYGLREYAELMTDFSIAERNINRAWSASADGYIDEVWLSLERANRQLQTVAEHLAGYQKKLPD